MTHLGVWKGPEHKLLSCAELRLIVLVLFSTRQARHITLVVGSTAIKQAAAASQASLTTSRSSSNFAIPQNRVHNKYRMHLISPGWGPLDTSQALQVTRICLLGTQQLLSTPAPAAYSQRNSCFRPLIEVFESVIYYCVDHMQALSDTNPDFTVIGICSAECSSVNSTTVASTLAAMLSRQQKQHAANSSPDSLRTKQLHGLQIHVSYPATLSISR